MKEFDNTPAKLIWDIREKVFGNRTVIASQKQYDRTDCGDDDDVYSGPNSVACAINMVNKSKDAFFKHLSELRDSGEEVAFQGFRVPGEAKWDESIFHSDENKINYDLPKCDMSFKEGEIDSPEVKQVLGEMKDYLDGANLSLYKTTNSFHVYGARILNREQIRRWMNFLFGLGKKFPKVIDTWWLKYNNTNQPLRISATNERGLPQLHKVI